MFLSKILLATAMLFSFHAMGERQANQKETAVNFSQIFVQKINLEDETVLVLTNGFFPNSCYEWSHSSVSHPTPYVHEVRGFANVTQDICLMMIQPFTQDIRIGRLEPGTHTVRVINGDGTRFEKEIIVEAE